MSFDDINDTLNKIREGNAKHALDVMTREEGTPKPYGGCLMNWGKWGKSYFGDLHSDPSGRWPEGTRITTSSVVREYQDEVGVPHIETRNTIYSLGEPQDE